MLSNNVHVKQQNKDNIQKYILHEYFITQNNASIKDKLKNQSKSVSYEPIVLHTSIANHR